MDLFNFSRRPPVTEHCKLSKGSRFVGGKCVSISYRSVPYTALFLTTMCLDLEISKPQRNTKKADNSNNERNNGARRRSRSPDYSRGGTGPQPRNVDRYTGASEAIQVKITTTISKPVSATGL